MQPDIMCCRKTTLTLTPNILLTNFFCRFFFLSGFLSQVFAVDGGNWFCCWWWEQHSMHQLSHTMCIDLHCVLSQFVVVSARRWCNGRFEGRFGCKATPNTRLYTYIVLWLLLFVHCMMLLLFGTWWYCLLNNESIKQCMHATHYIESSKGRRERRNGR